MEKPVPHWTIATAKARLSEAVDRAARQGPQIITRHGKPAAVLVSPDEWANKTSRVGSLASFLLNSPLRGAKLDLERVKAMPRALDL